MDVGEGVEIEFSANGKLTYTIRQSDRRQIMNLTYKAEGSEIVSNQPSAPAEIRTRYQIDDAGMLLLEFNGARSWYRRSPEDAG